MGVKRYEPENIRRGQILTAARKCFSQKGFHATSMRSIFAEAGLSSGSFYNYFTSKIEVVREICSEDQEGLWAELELVSQAPNPIEAIAHCVKNIVGFCHSTDARIWVEIYTEASRDKDIRNICDETEGPLRETFANSISRGKQDGLIPSELDVATLVDIVMASCWGSVSKLAYKPDTPIEQEQRIAYRNVVTLLTYS